MYFGQKSISCRYSVDAIVLALPKIYVYLYKIQEYLTRHLLIVYARKEGLK